VTLILITLHTAAYKTEEREQAVYLDKNKDCNCYERIYYCENIQQPIITVKLKTNRLKKLTVGAINR
jgi:hypothetical protein